MPQTIAARKRWVKFFIDLPALASLFRRPGQCIFLLGGMKDGKMLTVIYYQVKPAITS